MMARFNILELAPAAISLPVFDGLPPAVRAAIASADFAYDPRIMAGRLESGVREARVVAEIAAFDRRPQPWW
jgi:hypothetical protein